MKYGTDDFALVAAAPDGLKLLRRMVLAFAVRGALVPQTEDEPLTILGRDSQSLADEVGLSLPHNWIAARFDDICEIETELVDSTNFPDSLQIGPDCIEKETGRQIEKRTVRQAGVRGPNSRFRAGHILYSKIRPSLSKVLLVDFEGLCSADMYPLRSKIDPRFQVLMMLSDVFLDQVRLAENRVKMPKVNMESLSRFVVPVPPLAEQHRIVAKVDELMALCYRLEARQHDAEAAHSQLVQVLLDSLTQARDAEGFQARWERVAEQFAMLFTTESAVDRLEASIVELAISGRLVASSASGIDSDIAIVHSERSNTLSPAKRRKHDEDAQTEHWACPYELPASWRWVSLAAVVVQITDGTHHTPTYVSSGVPFISVKDIDGHSVSFDDCRYIPYQEHVEINERCNPERGDILLCRIGTLGRPTIVDTDLAFSLFVSVGLLKMPKRINITSYLHLFLRSPLAYRQYDRIKAGGSHTSKLNLGDIPRIMVPLPPAEDREQVLLIVGQVHDLCTKLRTRIIDGRAKHVQLAEALVAQAVAF